MAVNATTALNAPDGQVFGWVWDPDGRGTWTILRSCLITMTLCVYTALHLNLPPARSSSFSMHTRKAKWVVLGIFAPEIVVYIAWMQWRHVKSLTRDLRASFAEQEKKDPAARRKHDWTDTHSWFALMGGFAMDTSDEDDEIPGEYIHGSPRLFLGPNGAKILGNLGLLPDISPQYIKDKSKSDSLAKTLVIFQAGWLVAQCITRLAYRLPISNLELNTVAHALSAFAIYALWWQKPLDIRDPLIIKGDWVPETAATFIFCSGFTPCKPRPQRGMSKLRLWISYCLHWSEMPLGEPPSGESTNVQWIAVSEAEKYISGTRRRSKLGPISTTPSNASGNSATLFLIGPIKEEVTGFSLSEHPSMVQGDLPACTRVDMYNQPPDSREFCCIIGNFAVLSSLFRRTTIRNPYDHVSLVDVRRWQLVRRCLSGDSPIQSLILGEWPMHGPGKANGRPDVFQTSDPSWNFFPYWRPLDPEDASYQKRGLHGQVLRPRYQFGISKINEPSTCANFKDYRAVLGFCLPVLVYGSVHAKGWNEHFPSEFEGRVWQSSCVLLPAFGLLIGLLAAPFGSREKRGPVRRKALEMLAVLDDWLDYLVLTWEFSVLGKWSSGLVEWLALLGQVLSRMFEDVFRFRLERFLGYVLLVIALLTAGCLVGLLMFGVVFCRVFLVVESFISLRSLPARTFETPEWTEYLPHL